MAIVNTPLGRTIEEIELGAPEEIQAAILALAGALSATYPNRVRLMGPLSAPCVVRAQPYNSALIIKFL